MSVKQFPKEKSTKDGRYWVFYTYLTKSDDTRKKYMSKMYFNKVEVLKAKRDMINKIESKTINITDMTIKGLFNEFYIYKSDTVKQTTLRLYNQRIVYLKILLII